jgi:hypothetical protein
MEIINKSRTHAMIVGILFIIATAFLFIGKNIYEPILAAPNYLEIAYPQRQTAVIGILLEFACVISIPLIPVFMFPYLRKFYEPLALAYAAFRLFEAVLFVLVEINMLTLIKISQLFLESGGADSTYFSYLGEMIRGWNTWEFAVYVAVFTIGGLFFYSVLYRSKLVPRWISGWGFLAAALLLVGSVLSLLEVNFVGPGLFELIFAMPIAGNEMVLAVWLIVKGFDSAV